MAWLYPHELWSGCSCSYLRSLLSVGRHKDTKWRWEIETRYEIKSQICNGWMDAHCRIMDFERAAGKLKKGQGPEVARIYPVELGKSRCYPSTCTLKDSIGSCAVNSRRVWEWQDKTFLLLLERTNTKIGPERLSCKIQLFRTSRRNSCQYIILQEALNFW